MSAPLSGFETLVPHTLTICTHVEFAPFAHEEQGTVVGTDIALLKRFAERWDLQVRIIKKPFPHLWHMPGLDACDVAAAGMAALEERALGARGTWTIAYMTVQRSLLIRKTDAELLKTPEDFAEKKIVVTPGSTAEIDAWERYQPCGAEVISLVPSQEYVVRQLLQGDIAAFGEGDVSNGYLAEKYVDTQGQRQLVLTDLHVMDPPETLHFAVRTASTGLLDSLNTFIRSEQEN